VCEWYILLIQPSGQCQACLSDKSPEKDFMITCEICQSSIHDKHYGREIDESTITPSEKWRCERCRLLFHYAEKKRWADIEVMRCEFCPSPKGILKRVVFNSNQTIWVCFY
jgi:hypothetical protein